MARPTLRDILDRLEPKARDAFIQAILTMRSDLRMAALEAAIARGDVDAAIAIMGLDAAYFEPLDAVLREAIREGGAHAFAELAQAARGARVVGMFDQFNPRAQRLLAERSSALIVEITEGVRQSVRETLAEAMNTDASPRKVALDIVGRINRTTQRREGGLVGLTSMEASYVRRAREELESGDPARMAAYLERKARDKRHDATVLRAIREGRPVATADVDRMVGRYADRLLRIRGERIARTEVLGTLHAARNEGMEQLIDRGEVRRDAVVYVWKSAFDRDTRDTHRLMHNQERPRGTPFQSPLGALLMFPGDRSLGAPASEIINCRCHTVAKVDFITGLRDRLSPTELADIRGAIAAEDA